MDPPGQAVGKLRGKLGNRLFQVRGVYKDYILSFFSTVDYATSIIRKSKKVQKMSREDIKVSVKKTDLKEGSFLLSCPEKIN